MCDRVARRHRVPVTLPQAHKQTSTVRETYFPFPTQELIQNADDAGATEVKFLFDSRDNAFGTTSLINVGLSKFQGPALYVYNNGLFKEQDWIGIESIMQGSKKKDPVAAGRFGIGFNSVYHVTGTPKYITLHLSSALKLIGCKS